ncbi:hypothetical protein CEXT_222081 [Caerostris extrusa]|uniref:Uncharacterized protein n=1 Tax=Caerostris extrusa TaxID=172846 RepID=A0AAV4VVG3_CAEEX|nr:hypothetical protein CEXT_222081 [Caerostris extrusa]
MHPERRKTMPGGEKRSEWRHVRRGYPTFRSTTRHIRTFRWARDCLSLGTRRRQFLKIFRLALITNRNDDVSLSRLLPLLMGFNE